MADIFLSYSRRDSELMQRLRSDLLQFGFTVWTDEGLEAGTPSWLRAIEAEIEEARCVVVILSPDAKQSKWVEIEVSIAEENGLRIFPVLAKGNTRTAVLFRLRTTQRVDIREDYQKVNTQLAPALQRYLQPVRPASSAAGPDASAGRAVLPESPRPAKPGASIEFDWVTINAGEFLMGSDEQTDTLARADELPQHPVYLPIYRIARVPVTNAQYKRFVETAGYQLPSNWKQGKLPKEKEDHPVVTVSWRDAQAFCRWAGVRLPTEAEWEKAARGTDGRIWPWGNEQPTEDRANFTGGMGGTTPVGQYPQGASPYGVLDMAGNVWEWTSSLYREYPYQANDGREDPESRESRALRGGSFYFNDYNHRCAARDRSGPDNQIDHIGFRVVFSGF